MAISKAEMDTLCRAVGRALAESLAPLKKRIAELEEKSVRYCGVWKAGTSYGRNAMVTDKGAVWISRRISADRPGTSDAWQLAAKSKDISR